MGITIHYQGHATDAAALRALLDAATAFAKARGWAVQHLHEAELDFVRLKNGRIDEGPARLSGAILAPHAGNEPVWLLFDEDLWLCGFTKTQFMPLETHVEIVRLLREIAPHFRGLEVTDEGGYWESGDLNVLIEKMAFLRDAIEGVVKRLEGG